MSSVTFLGILSELVPSGILPQMSEGLNVSYSSIGLLVSIYAIASAVGTIPLITLTMEMNRKKLLMILLIIFGVSNAVIAITSSYYIIAAARLAGGVSAGILWPMVSAYAMRLVPANQQGKAIAVTMAGSTLGLGVGLPIMTTIGTEFGWRVTFGVLAAVIFIVAFLGQASLPTVEGEKRTKTNSLLYIIRNKSVIICLIVTFLTIMANYGLYTYISPLSEYFEIYGGIKIVSILFGKGTMIISHGAFFIWGVSFGALVTIFQAAVTKQVETGKDVATSLQSSTFNFGIVLGSALGGLILDNSSVFYIIFVTMALLVVPILLSFSKKRIFS